MSAYRRVFFDSGAYIALADSADANHGAAVDCLSGLGPKIQRVTSWGVIAETYTWLRYHLAPPVGLAWLQVVAETQTRGVTQVVRPDVALDALCRRQLHRYADQRLSYVDGLTLAIVQSQPGVDAIFAFDRHLLLAGIPLLPTLPAH